jgi:hypothetical protein
MTSFLLERARILFAGTLCLTVALGCSGGPKIPKTVTVRGKVMYQDKPLAGAEVGFIPKAEGKEVLAARGTTNQAGEFTLKTFVDAQNDLSGATPGEFVVVVSKVETMDDEKMREEFAANPAMELKKLVPTKYTDPKESTLTATVTDSGPNNFEFKLED